MQSDLPPTDPPDDPPDVEPPDDSASMKPARRGVLSLREYLGLVTIAMLLVGLGFTGLKLRRIEVEVARLRAESGYLAETDPGQIAAARAPSDLPLTYRIRVRTPTSGPGASRFRVAYSSIWPRQASSPDWYGAVPVPPGESMVTIRILEDPRDRRWKISASIGSTSGTRRMATVLPSEHAGIFRQSHDVVSTGVGRETFAVASTRAIRLLDERWLVGEGSLLLYGDRAPERDQVGIYAELQPDVEPL